MININKQIKAEIEPEIKRICKKHGVKATLSCKYWVTAKRIVLCLNIKNKRSSIDFIANYKQVNNMNDNYWLEGQVMDLWDNSYQTYFTDSALIFLQEAFTAMNKNNSESISNGWEACIEIGDKLIIQ